jgi:chaperone required for assembly of F1-ATPase
MKRFYKDVTSQATDGGWHVLLDGRLVKTPGKAPLLLPSQRIADAIAGEWAAQGDTIDTHAMPITRYANTTLDRVIPRRSEVVDDIAKYAGTDLICYRAQFPADLVGLQAEAWDPLVAWARRRYDAVLRVTAGVMHAPQPDATLAALRRAVNGTQSWALAPLHSAVSITGSLVIGLALLDGELGADTAWRAGQLDELYQIERWGEDAESAKARAARRADLDSAARMLLLVA